MRRARPSLCPHRSIAIGSQAGLSRIKEFNRRKRHIVVNTLGLILAVQVHPANVRDYYGAMLVLAVLGQLKLWFYQLKVIFADSYYGRNKLPESVRAAFGWVFLSVLRAVPISGFWFLPLVGSWNELSGD